jgi:hypothetical protein
LQGDYGFLNGSFTVFDLTDPTKPEIVASLEEESDFGLSITDTFAFCAAYSEGVIVFDISIPTDPIKIQQLPAAGWAEDVRVIGDYAYVANEEFYILDVSSPVNPIEMGSVELSGWANGLAIAGDYAYVAEDEGFHVVDVSDPAQPVDIAYLPTADRGNDVTLYGNYACVASGSGGLEIFDITTPEAPQWISNIVPMGVGEPYASDLAIKDSYALVAFNDRGLIIYDIVDPNTITEVSRVDTFGTIVGVAVQGNLAYICKWWSELIILDITDPNQPVLMGRLDTPYGPKDVTVKDRYAYIANLNDGLQIADVLDPTHPVIVGSFQTGERAYGVDVKDDLVFVADRMDGLFIIRNDLLTRVEKDDQEIHPEEFVLLPNYPNPFNPVTQIAFLNPKSQVVRLSVVDVQGREIIVIIDRVMDAGYHVIPFNGSELPSGVYLYRLEAGERVHQQKMILLK